MSQQIEEIQIRKYEEYLLGVDPPQWQWFEGMRCFEVGDAAARPRVFFRCEQQFLTYTLEAFLEVDGEVVTSQLVHVGKEMPSGLDDLLMHLTAMDHPPLLIVLLARLLRSRHAMMTEERPPQLRARIEELLTVWQHRLFVDLPHNLQERVMMYRINRLAARVLPKSRRA